MPLSTSEGATTNPTGPAPWLRQLRDGAHHLWGRQVTTSRHFQTQPLAFLAAPAAAISDDLEAQCRNVPQAFLRQAPVGGRAGSRGRALGEALKAVVTRWSQWAVVLRWIHACAKPAGFHAGAFPFSNILVNMTKLWQAQWMACLWALHEETFHIRNSVVGAGRILHV